MNNGQIAGKSPNIWKLNNILLNNFMSQKKSQGKLKNKYEK